MLPSVHFESLGCRLNQDETEGAAEAFRKAGFACTLGGLTSSSKERGDVVLSVLNTCTVTGKAEQKARRMMRLMLLKFPNATLIVTGCYATLEEEAIKSINPNRILVLGGSKKQSLSLLPSLLADKTDFSPEALSLLISKKTVELSPFTLYTPVFQKHSRASLKIQDGCNFSCSYCRICLARGKSVSLSKDEVIRRAQKLEQQGFAELVLTGVNLCQYCDDTDKKKTDLAALITLILQNTQKIKIRLSSLYPQAVDLNLCASLSSPRVQPYFHLSIQSGSPRILKMMKRPHSIDEVTKALKMLRDVKQNPFISCDIIAGFPGETDEDFYLTESLCRSSGFAWIHAFPFSARPGTEAKDMGGQVSESVKADRVRCLTRIAEEGKILYIRQNKGKSVSAVLENREDSLCAVTENFLHVSCSVKEGVAFQRGKECTIVIGEPLEESIKSGGEADCTGLIIG